MFIYSMPVMKKATPILVFLLYCSLNSFSQADTVYVDREYIYKENAVIKSVFLFAVCNEQDRPMYEQMMGILRKQFAAAKVRTSSGIMDERVILDSIGNWMDRIRSSSMTMVLTLNKLTPASFIDNRYAGDTTGKLLNASLTNNLPDDGATVATIALYVNGATAAPKGETAARLLFRALSDHGFMPEKQ